MKTKLSCIRISLVPKKQGLCDAFGVALDQLFLNTLNSHWWLVNLDTIIVLPSLKRFIKSKRFGNGDFCHLLEVGLLKSVINSYQQ